MPYKFYGKALKTVLRRKKQKRYNWKVSFVFTFPKMKLIYLVHLESKKKMFFVILLILIFLCKNLKGKIARRPLNIRIFLKYKSVKCSKRGTKLKLWKTKLRLDYAFFLQANKKVLERRQALKQ